MSDCLVYEPFQFVKPSQSSTELFVFLVGMGVASIFGDGIHPLNDGFVGAFVPLFSSLPQFVKELLFVLWLCDVLGRAPCGLLEDLVEDSHVSGPFDVDINVTVQVVEVCEVVSVLLLLLPSFMQHYAPCVFVDEGGRKPLGHRLEPKEGRLHSRDGSGDGDSDVVTHMVLLVQDGSRKVGWVAGDKVVQFLMTLPSGGILRGDGCCSKHVCCCKDLGVVVRWFVVIPSE